MKRARNVISNFGVHTYIYGQGCKILARNSTNRRNPTLRYPKKQVFFHIQTGPTRTVQVVVQGGHPVSPHSLTRLCEDTRLKKTYSVITFTSLSLHSSVSPPGSFVSPHRLFNSHFSVSLNLSQSLTLCCSSSSHNHCPLPVTHRFFFCEANAFG